MSAIYKKFLKRIRRASAFSSMARNPATDRWAPFYDPNSYANAFEYNVTNISVKLNVDFAQHVLSGSAALTVVKAFLSSNLSGFLHLDSRGLKITAVRDGNNRELQYEVIPRGKILGDEIKIKLPESNTDMFCIKLDYETSPDATAIQWLEPSQTKGGKHPFMFTQCQPIHCRSMIPCQDTPSVKQTYDAEITAPEDLTALMSAKHRTVKDPKDGLKTFCFKQDYPIPSYLIAMVVGHLASGDLSYRSKVWCEPEMLEEAVYEFAEVDKLLRAAESLLGPYLWGNYDMLVLPPSFPYGGMENPCLTFLTPTLIAGDRSLVNVVAHEIAHSWTGNLMTNKNWENFWLNEGHTRYMEEKIIGVADGKASAGLLNYLGWHNLRDEVERQGPKGPFTSLVTNLKDADPDEHFSVIPYEKGAAFLHYLEDLFGESDFFQFIQTLVRNFQFQSFDSYEYKEFLTLYFTQMGKSDLLQKIDWEVWFHAPGMPSWTPKLDTSLHEKALALCNRWIEKDYNDNDFSCDDLKDFTPMQVMDFLDLLIRKNFNSHTKLEKMNELYKLNDAKNCEFKFRWLTLCTKAKYKPCIEPTLEFLDRIGRMKYIKPLYTNLADWPEAKPLAVEQFQKHRSQMHSVSAALVASILKI